MSGIQTPDGCFRDARAALAHAEALLQAGRTDDVIGQARLALSVLHREASLPGHWDAPSHALLRWRLHTILAGLTGDLVHFHEAALARPEVPSSRAALGCALARARRLHEAIHHLQRAVAGDPADSAAVRALHHALGEIGDATGQQRLASTHAGLGKAAQRATSPATSQPVRTGQELASIIILCCNELDYTRQCLDSVLAHTRAPYELILVDNGSNDGTPAYLESLKTRGGPARLTVVRNETNRGFAAGCNQGVAAARGEYLVFLNNDTIVTPGWLDGLIGWMLSDWPRVGMVGPVASYAAAPQQIAIDYRTPAELVSFAARRRTEHGGKSLSVRRLVGFCLLVRRDVLEKIGGRMDEQYGAGFFEDDDLSLRVHDAGFRLLVAQDVFIHHYGSRTFKGLGIDCMQQLKENFALFRAKWGTERTAGYRLSVPASASPNAAASADGQTGLIDQQPKVSLCMIVKDEEAHIGRCLQSVADLVDEIVVVDTGSTDRTRDIATESGARVVDFTWVDSFAAARNESLRHARGQWVLWLDADEHLDENNRQNLRQLLASLSDENAGYVMRQFSPLAEAPHAAAQVDQVRLFRNRPDIRWEYRVHEQIMPSIRRVGGDLRATDVVIAHAGFADASTQAAKVARNRRLLELELSERPEDAFVLFNLGAIALTDGRCREALDLLRRSLARAQAGDALVPKLHAFIVRAHINLGERDEAFAAVRAARAALPDDAELLYWEAVLVHGRGDLLAAQACLRAILQQPARRQYTAGDAGLHGYRTRHFLGQLYREEARFEEAEAEWRSAVAESPRFAAAWLNLAELYLEQERWAELDDTVRRLEKDGYSVEVARLRARRNLARKVASRPKVSLCMIVKDEAANLPECLASVDGLVDEIIVVDTGSSDATKQIAAQRGAKVFDFPWVDSFAAARNESVRHASGEWILWLDADDRLEDADRAKLRQLIAELPEDRNAVYSMKCVCTLAARGGDVTVVDHVRLFPNRPELRWEHRAHEQIATAVQRLGLPVKWSTVRIHHVGYHDPQLRQRKLERNLRLILMEAAERPSHFVNFCLGQAYSELGRSAEAVPLLRACIDSGKFGESTERKLHALLVNSRLQLKQESEIISDLQAARAKYPDDIELLFLDATLRIQRRDYGEAERCLLQLLAGAEDEYFGSVDAGLRSYKARSNLALIYAKSKRQREAEKQWQAALRERPDFAAAWLGLGELYLSQKRWADAEGAANQLAELSESGVAQADFLRARARLAQGQWTAAKRLISTVIPKMPKVVAPRLVLCQVLLREGKDWVAAEQALREVLELEPNHARARRDLEVVLQRKGQALDGPGRSGPATVRPKVSLCMIVKNEESNLPDCLASVKDLVDEIIVVDTGSTDATKEMAAERGAKVFEFPWVDSFAAARNESLRHATGDWVLWLDADDRIDRTNRGKLRTLLRQLPSEGVGAYVMKCVCLPDPDAGNFTEVDHVRLFRHHPELRWEHRVHEQIMPAVRRRGGDVVVTDVRIHHTGYQDRALRRRKLQRDLRLLRLEESERPDHPFTLFNLGCALQELGQHAEAIGYLRRSLDGSSKGDSIVRKLYALLVQSHRQLGQLQEARALCTEGRKLFPEDSELLFREGLISIDLQDFAAAASCLERLLEAPPATYLSSLDPGIRGYLARTNLAEVYRVQGRLGEAEAQWRAVLSDKPDYRPALRGLAEVCLTQNRDAELLELAQRLDAMPGGNGEGMVLRARAHMAKNEFGETRQLLTDAIRRHPRQVQPRVILTHALLKEGKDWAAAEQALLGVLALDPLHAESCRNLTLLLQDRRRAGDASVGGPASLAALYQAACALPSDINEHCPTLFELAKQCDHVTEMGTRTGVSTTALLHAQPGKLVCYDRAKHARIELLEQLAGRTALVFHTADVLKVEIEETDMLFIDTWHVYEQLQEELRLHACRARRYIVLHDTTTFGDSGETPGHRGLWPAVEEFLAEGSFRLKERRTNNNGLTILERIEK